MIGLWLSDADLDLDVLPVIAEILAKRGGKLPNNAAYFTEAIRTHAQERRAAPPAQPADDEDPERKSWRARVGNAWLKHGYWKRDEWGPAPDEPGCRVPADLMPTTIPASRPVAAGATA